MNWRRRRRVGAVLLHRLGRCLLLVVLAPVFAALVVLAFCSMARDEARRRLRITWRNYWT